MLNLRGSCEGFYLKFRQTVLRFCDDVSAATAIEYALLVGFIGVATMVTITSVGTAIRDDVFNAISSALTNSASSGDGG